MGMGDASIRKKNRKLHWELVKAATIKYNLKAVATTTEP
uniref:Uncharacterized protein n=1 Tax=Setaria italica TaxID=4555 RepID=K3ZPR4_SETIT